MNDTPDERKPWPLEHRRVDVWRIMLDHVPASMEMRSSLSEDERARSTLFTMPLERQRFIASRIVLRHILAGYQGVDAAALVLAREPGGRPYIEGNDRVFFSLSHSGDMALVAIADVAVGVDVERIRHVRLAGAIARRLLHPEAVAVLQSLPAAGHDAAFIDAWTQREAHVKAVGGGLFRTPDALPFDHAQPGDATVREVVSRDDGRVWSVARFEPNNEVRAAVVIPGSMHGLRLIDWVAHSENDEERS